MDLQTLRRVATEGLPVNPQRLADVIAFCSDWCRASGDARFCVLAELFAELEDWLGDMGVPLKLLEDVNDALQDSLVDVLDAATAADGAYFADALVRRIRTVLLPPSAWGPEHGVSP